MLNYRSFSQVILCGRLGQDAQLRSTKTGMKMLSFGVGTSVSAKGADGAYTQKTTWHDCLMFGPRTEKLVSVLTKGTTVCVQGSISYKDVELKTGYKGKTASILIDDIQILAEGKPREAAQAPAQNAAAQTGNGSAADEELPCCFSYSGNIRQLHPNAGKSFFPVGGKGSG